MKFWMISLPHHGQFFAVKRIHKIDKNLLNILNNCPQFFENLKNHGFFHHFNKCLWDLEWIFLNYFKQTKNFVKLMNIIPTNIIQFEKLPNFGKVASNELFHE